jgi:transposase
MPQKPVVQLGGGDRQQLRSLICAGRAPARTLTHARILLKIDQEMFDEQIAEELEVSTDTVARVRQRFVQHGLAAALQRRPQPPRPGKRKLDGDGQAHLIALACSAPPTGHARWTLRLLAHRLVEMEYVAGVSHETVRTALKKTT